ncbi:hypothetical protein CY34DRAFT_490609 [Suillus luteus UH-Slu-Lm8-n1]|uniref:Uncharacterized protein n=1 Tax=Suillus luteus UH-Slu-Lm8-n1 TaxID=930992 RepID=A0A0D0A5G4_9AGAM|nr:hypothetical protein CY34DRAFT_490609 [Suillus luteus UH-Slu-Lm8-n1]
MGLHPSAAAVPPTHQQPIYRVFNLYLMCLSCNYVLTGFLESQFQILLSSTPFVVCGPGHRLRSLQHRAWWTSIPLSSQVIDDLRNQFRSLGRLGSMACSEVTWSGCV